MQGGYTKPPHSPTLHPRIMKALATLGITQELFASPLDCSTHIPQYHSQHEKDQLFGAQYNAYSTAWGGASIAHPEHEDKGTQKAIRWAIACAQAANSGPTCTIMALPVKPASGYTTYLVNNPMVTIIDTIPAHCMPYEEPQTWTGGKHQDAMPRPKALHVIAITNRAGWDTYIEPHKDSFPAAWQHAMTNTSQTGTKPRRIQSIRGSPHHAQAAIPTVHPHKALRALLPQTPPTHPGLPARRPAPDLHTFPCTVSTLPKFGIQLYTDGSSTDQPDRPNLLGAGIYNATNQTGTRINPGGKDTTRTNNRAEMVALYTAIRIHMEADTITIYTDSLCSIQHIQTMLNNPARLRESNNHDLVYETASLMAHRALTGKHTNIYKVRSHTGIEGNDKADTLAKEAATLPATTLDHHITVGEQARPNMFWPTLPDQEDATHPDPPRRRQASNLTSDIKRRLPKACHTGAAKTDGVYATLWQQTNPTLHKASSNHYWTSTQVTWHQKQTLHKFRWGTAWHKKRAYRCKMPYAGSTHPVTNDTCPICHCCQDGAGHILAGCSHRDMRAGYIKRHDQAVKLIHKYSSKLWVQWLHR